MIKTTLIFDHRNRTAAGSDGPVEIRVTVSRKSYYINTGIKCKKKEWSAASISEECPGAIALNRRLRILLDYVNEELNDCILNQKPIDVKEIGRKMWQTQCDQSETLYDWIGKQIPQLHIRPVTMRRYETLLNRLQEYGHIRYWSDLTVENIYDWDAWLHQLKKPQKDADRKAGIACETISDAAVYNYHKCLKALLARAARMGKIDINPYDRLRGEFSRGDVESVEFLEEEEVKAFEGLHPLAGSPMAVARDLFVFQMHTGLSYSDTQVFDFSQYKEMDGHWTYIGPRVKTGVEYVTMLDDECMDILDRYGRQLPKMQNSEYNQMLKALGMAAGISKSIHSHMARHTFATRMLANNVKMENVAKMLGHTNTVQTHRYAKVLPQSVFDDFINVTKKKRY